jgi:ABC-2 type transport system ATP-binding protein
MHEYSIQRTNTSLRAGIVAHGLGKRFGELWALSDFDLEVPAGTVLGLLGHNGAGKTTAVRLLTTLAQPTTGSAHVDGLDIVRDAAAVRSRIGLAGQSATVDDLLSARANLELVGRLYHQPRAVARRRAAELLERLSLSEHADRLVKTFSGGMRRRLDLAATLVAAPPVLFLDEPTTGLDPVSRNELWALLRELVDAGTTLLLTTQYLEEADRLADQIVLLDQGRKAAAGTPAQLKARVGGERIDVTLVAADHLPAGEAALAPFADGPAASDVEERVLTVPVRAGTPLLEIARALDHAGVAARDVHRREATLDDVFLTLTNRAAAPAAVQPDLPTEAAA